MMRRITVAVGRGNEIKDISWEAARVMGDPIKQGGKYVQDAGLAVSGCGMDMGFHVVSTLSAILFPDGFGCIGRPEGDAVMNANGERVWCPSNDHTNGDRDYRLYRQGRRHWHSSGDYALVHRWL